LFRSTTLLKGAISTEPFCADCWIPNGTWFWAFPSQQFAYCSLSFQSSFHLSFTVLVRYRLLAPFTSWFDS